MHAASGARLSASNAGSSAEARRTPPEEVGEVAPAEVPALAGASAGAVAAASRLADVRSAEVASTGADEVSPADAGEVPQGRAGAPAGAGSPGDVAVAPLRDDARGTGRERADHSPLFVAPLVVEALDPRPVRDRLPRGAALAELDRELRSVMLWTLRAITGAWDTRRLGYGNEGRHPYEHEVAALVGKNAGFAPDYLAAARDSLAEHEAALAADPQHRARPTPIAELRDELGLSPGSTHSRASRS